MAVARLTVNLNSIRENWRRLNSLSSSETAAVVKANAYGLCSSMVTAALAREGVRTFFVAVAEEGQIVRETIGSEGAIYIFSGHMEGDTQFIRDYSLIPLINSYDQLNRHLNLTKFHPFGLQLDTGMNRLGVGGKNWKGLLELAISYKPKLIMSHLACADESSHLMNKNQLRNFQELTKDISVPRSLSATGGILLGKDYHFDLTRPGIGLYGGFPFSEASPVVALDIPVIQFRDVKTGESVGYGNAWIAPKPTRIAILSAGYADGIIRAMGAKTFFYAGDQKCRILGRISMDLIAVDVSHVANPPDSLALLNNEQRIDHLAKNASTIGYEILTSLGARYKRRYVGA